MGEINKPLQHINKLAAATPPSKVTMETEYGLILEFHLKSDNSSYSITPRLRDDVIKASPPEPSVNDEPVEEVERPEKLQYRIFPDYGTDHIWYDVNHPRGPTTEAENVGTDQRGKVEDGPLKAWIAAFAAWGERYDEAFDRELNQTEDYYRPVFPNRDDEEEWGLQGLLLAVWLALLPETDRVRYGPSSKKREMLRRDAEGEASIGSILARLLGDPRWLKTDP